MRFVARVDVIVYPSYYSVSMGIAFIYFE